MNKPKAKSSIILTIFFLILGIIFTSVGKMFPTPEDILENGGEKVNAFILEVNSEETYTRVQIDDEDSFYDGDIVEVSQYSSNLYEGGMTTVYYDGETLLLSSVSGLPTIFITIGRILKGCGAFVLIIFIIRFIIFALKVGVAGLAVGSIANEVHQQEQFNNQFYGNSEGRTVPYDVQGYPQYDNQNYQYNQQYQQPYDNQYNQQYQNQQQYQQPYNQQYTQYQNQQYQQQNNYRNQ